MKTIKDFKPKEIEKIVFDTCVLKRSDIPGLAKKVNDELPDILFTKKHNYYIGYYIDNKKGRDKYPNEVFLLLNGIEPMYYKGYSIGWCEAEQKWYGWSHRAIYGFKIGDKVKKTSAGYNKNKGEWTAKTLDDAKEMALDFSKGVS